MPRTPIKGARCKNLARQAFSFRRCFSSFGRMNIVLSIVVLASIALLLGAWLLKRRGGSTKQCLLMVLLSFIMLGNVVIWSLPTPDGQTLSQAAEAQSAD